MLKPVTPEKLVLGIANYGYDWPVKTKKNPHPAAKAVTFEEAMVTAVESDTQVEYDPDSLNPHFSYEDENNQVHDLWLLDGVTAYNQVRTAERYGVRGTVLWRLGEEDPSMWPIWDTSKPDDATRKKLEDIPPGYDLILEGDGDIWRITATPQNGRRTIQFDPDANLFTDENFQTYPLYWRLHQMVAVPKQIALAFDDGPDPDWTPRILTILNKKQAPP